MQVPRDCVFLDTVDPSLATRRRVLARAFAVIWRIELPTERERQAVQAQTTTTPTETRDAVRQTGAMQNATAG